MAMKRKGRAMDDAVKSDLSKRVAVVVASYIEREIKMNKLRGQYLGTFTGGLRQNSGAIVDTSNGVSVWVGTAKDYGVNYETGDWTGYKASREYMERYRRQMKAKGIPPGRNNKWAGDHGKRPFLRDSIECRQVQQKINAKLQSGVPL